MKAQMRFAGIVCFFLLSLLFSDCLLHAADAHACLKKMECIVIANGERCCANFKALLRQGGLHKMLQANIRSHNSLEESSIEETDRALLKKWIKEGFKEP